MVFKKHNIIFGVCTYACVYYCVYTCMCVQVTTRGPTQESSSITLHFIYWGSLSLNLGKLASQQTLGILLSLPLQDRRYRRVRLHIGSGNWTWVLMLRCQAPYQLSYLSSYSHYIFLIMFLKLCFNLFL